MSPFKAIFLAWRHTELITPDMNNFTDIPVHRKDLYLHLDVFFGSPKAAGPV